MLRFRCPACDRSIKAPESLAGRKIACPRCHGTAHVPEAKPQAMSRDEPPDFFLSMSLGLRLAVVSAAVGGVVGLLVSVLGQAGWVTNCGLAAATCSVLGLLVMLHGHGTGCPCCGAWWSRRKVGVEVGERETFDRDGLTFKRSTTQTRFACDGCGHAWSVADSEEYPVREPSRMPRFRA